MKANLLRLIGFAAVVLLAQLIVEHYPKAFLNINWLVIAATQAVLFVVFGAIAFHFYAGNGWTRLAFTIAIPALANSVQELVTGSAPGYPFLLLALIVPYAVAFGVGAVVMALIARVVVRRRRDNRLA